ncbi:MAG: putative Ig domain-containing protein [Acidobacteriaceae bacterium]
MTYTAPGTVTTAFTVTITATSVKDSSVTNSVTLNIPTNPAITTALGALTAGQVGSTYSVTIAPSGGISPYTWTVKSGNLPTGLTLGASTGTIGGIPTATGNYTFTLQVADSGAPTTLTASGQFTIDIASAPAIVFSTTSLPNGTIGTIYSSSVSATGGAGALTFAVTSGSLPAGLSLASSGVLTGTPTTAGASSFKVTASDAYGDTGSATFSITINYPQLTVTTSSLPTGYVGTAYPSTALAASGGSNSGYSWTWSAASGSSLPAGLSLSTSGMISGKPASAGTFSVVVTVKDSASNTANATLAMTVDPAVSVTTASLPNGYANSVYPNTTLAAAGGAGSPYTWTWSAASGSSLPAGLSLSGAGVISGTPTTAGAYSVVVAAEDSAKNSGSATLSLTVGAGITISTASLPGGYQGTPYASTTLTAKGGSGMGYAWTWAAASGSSLPAGLSLSGTGTITGTPTAAGTYSVVVTVKDSANNSAQATFSITVEGTIAITTTTLPTGYANSAYPSTTLSATGGSGGFTWTWAAASGSSIPPGLSLSTAGVVTGTPTTAGTYSVVVTANDSAGHTQTATLTVTVDAGVSISTTSLPAGYVGSAYTQTSLAASGGAGSPYTWTWAAAAGSSLPGGLNFSGAGVLTGTPTTSGSYSVVITAKDSAGNTGSKTFTITVGGAVSITTTSLLSGNVNLTYTQTTLTATGGAGAPYTWSWVAGSGSSLPAGLTLSSAGVISGTPTAAGTFSVIVTAKDSAGNTAQAAFSIVIEAQLTVTTASLPQGALGAVYPTTSLAASGGTGKGYAWTWAAQVGSSLPPGLNFSSAGVISGTPTTTGTYTIVFTVTDSAKNTANASLLLSVNPAVSVTTPSLPSGYVSAAYAQTTLAATGGAGAPYTWTWAAGAGSSLPGGLMLSGAGVIAGSPTTAGVYTVVITVKDSVGNTGSKTFSISIGSGVSITTTSLPSGYVTAAYTQTTLAATGGAGAPYTWTWAAASGSSLPGGLTLSSAGLISGTPTTAGSYSVVFAAKDSANNTGSATFSIVVEAKLAFTPTTLPTGAVSEVYPSSTLMPSGGTGSGYSFAATGMPPGLVLSAAGVISGTPTTQGTYSSVVVTLKDSGSNSSNTTLTITINASLAITTASPLAYGVTGAPYSQQLTATGGTGTLTWTATSSNLGGFALSLSGTGLVSGTPNGPGTINFTANVKDSSGATASVPFTFTVYSGLQQNAASLPLTGTTGVTYSGTISGTGGSGNYCWTVTGLSDGLTAPANNAPCGYAASSITISGTPTSAATVAPTVKLIDTTTNLSDSMPYSIVISNPTPLTLPAPEPASLPSATVNDYYNGSITAVGGVGPAFTWTVDGNGISQPGLSVSIGDGLSASTSDNNILTITGTPTTTTPANSPISFSVQVMDNYGHSASQDYSIAVNNVSTISGQIQLLDYNSCNGNGPTYPTFAVSINTDPVQVTSTDSQGNFSFSNLPNGTYTITPSITGAESIFYPANYSGVVISNNSVTGENFGVSIAYAVSGNITYNGAFTGTTYINLQPSGCGGGDGYPGASIPQTTLSGGGAYTIRGVPPGDYTVMAWMDPLGDGQQNTEDPTGSAALVVSTSNVTGANITMVNPTQSAPTQAVKFKAIAPTNLGAIISYGSGSVENSSGVEVFTSYIVQWSQSTSGFGTTNTGSGSATFAAVGSHANVWIVNNGIKGITGSFSNNQAYYFRVQGLNPAGAGPWTYYAGPSVVCNTTTCATTVTIGAPYGAGYYEVSGTVTIPSSITPKGPLYVGMFDQNTNTAYGTEIASPSNSTPNNYTVYVPNGTAYFNFAILNQNNDGLIAAVGDISNTEGNNSQAIVVNGAPLTNQDITLPAAASTASVTTSYSQNVNPGGSNTNYGIGLNVRMGNGSKLPVNVTFTSGPNVLHPVDLGNSCQGCGTPQWQYYPSLENIVPKVGDSYTFNITYSDATSETITQAVTAVLGSSDAVSALTPSPNTTTATTTPTFTWTYPTNAGNYTYQFYLQQNDGPTIWQIPGNNSNSNGFTNTQIPMPAGLLYGTDPTDNTNTPLYSSLTGGLQYNWSIQAQDSNGNSASVSTYFAPQ